ncbi:hypothetical protein [Rhodopila sp.]|uniref:hypothetical protein n=1 Tax=Rhodopila sp. TaxID=2480087 RepID=UPI003D10B938
MSKDLAESAQRMADLLAAENDALKRLDFAAATALVTAKEQTLADLAKHQGRSTPSPALAAIGQLVAKLAAENQLLLERSIAVQTRIVRIVARACAPPPSVARYGGHGRSTTPRATAALALSTRA